MQRLYRKNAVVVCPKCREEISLEECFKDKAVENELKTATIKCTNQDCPWEGPGEFYKVSFLLQLECATDYSLIALIIMALYLHAEAHGDLQVHQNSLS